jgi:hypothetical protein
MRGTAAVVLARERLFCLLCVLQVNVWLRLYEYDPPRCFLTQSFSNACRDLSSNQLTGSIPDSIGNLNQLQNLYDE